MNIYNSNKENQKQSKYFIQKNQLWSIIDEINKVKLTRRLFSINLSERLNLKTLIINWDDYLFNINTKNNYLWTWVGIIKKLKIDH